MPRSRGCDLWDRCCSRPRRLGCTVVTMLHWRRGSGGFCLINIKPASSPPTTNPLPPSLFLVVVGEVTHYHLLAVRPFFGSLWSICSLSVHTQTVHPLCVLTRSLRHRMLRHASTRCHPAHAKQQPNGAGCTRWSTRVHRHAPLQPLFC